MYECFLTCIYVYHIHAWYPQRPKEDFRSPESRVTDSCEPSPGSWKPNLDPLQKPQERLTAEPSLRHLGGLFTWGRISLCFPDWPGPHHVVQTGLQLAKVWLPATRQRWGERCSGAFVKMTKTSQTWPPGGCRPCFLRLAGRRLFVKLPCVPSCGFLLSLCPSFLFLVG